MAHVCDHEWASSPMTSQEGAAAQLTFCKSAMFSPPLQHCALFESTTILVCASNALATSAAPPGLPLHDRKFKLAASPVVTSLVLGKGLWGISFVPWSSAELLVTRGSAQGCGVRTCSESEESGDTSGVLQLCYGTCVALGFFTGDLFPNSYFPFSRVFSLFRSQYDLD